MEAGLGPRRYGRHGNRGTHVRARVTPDYEGRPLGMPPELDTFPCMDGNVVTVEREIAAPAEKIFDLLANPAKHSVIDGSGTVKQARSSPSRLAKGATFGMSMRIGVPYAMVNTVVEFEEDRRIAWQPHLAGPLGRVVGGRVWRYQLEPTAQGTLVRESWDISRDPLRGFLKRGPMPKRTRENMEKTLERISKIVSSTAGAGGTD